jgi:UDP-glucose 4-epimerase
MKISGQTFVVTGGGGFVGFYIVEELLKRGAGRVVVYDKALNNPKLTALAKDRRLEMMEGDITDAGRLARAFAGAQGVFHMAVLPLGACEKDPGLAFEVNIRGTFQVITEAVKAGVGKLVYTSASSVYGDTRERMDEQHPFNAWSMYGVSKLCGEFLLRPFHAKLPHVVMRYMNVYGPGQAGGLIPAVLSKITSGQSPVISGDGSASFDFVHVQDVARCTVLGMEADVTGEAFNVGSGTEVTVKDIVGLLLALTGSSVAPTYVPDAPGAMTRRVGNNEKAMRLLGFQASIGLRDGLQELVKGVRG